MLEDWALGRRDQCSQARVAFFFKQCSAVNKKRAGRLLSGRTWDQMSQSDSAALVPASSRRFAHSKWPRG
jgi:protein gp37